MYKRCLFFFFWKRLRWRELTMLCIVLSVYTNFQVDISKHIEFADSSRQIGVGNCISSRDKKRNLLSHSQYDDMCLNIWWIMLKCSNVLNAFIFPCFWLRHQKSESPTHWPCFCRRNQIPAIIFQRQMLSPCVALEDCLQPWLVSRHVTIWSIKSHGSVNIRESIVTRSDIYTHQYKI